MRITSLCFTYPFKRTQWKYYYQERKHYFLVKATRSACPGALFDPISMKATVYMLLA